MLQRQHGRVLCRAPLTLGRDAEPRGVERCGYCDFSVAAPLEETRQASQDHVCGRQTRHRPCDDASGSGSTANACRTPPGATWDDPIATPQWLTFIALALGAWFVLSIVSGPLVGQLLRARGLAAREERGSRDAFGRG
jgi:hypothetical protein